MGRNLRVQSRTAGKGKSLVAAQNRGPSSSFVLSVTMRAQQSSSLSRLPNSASILLLDRGVRNNICILFIELIARSEPSAPTAKLKRP
jgi:hypothetical protein